jgi:uncharacterized membrane protein
MRGITILAALSLLSQADAYACTACDSEAGLRLRNEIFGDGFYRRLAEFLAPLPLLLGAVAAAPYLMAGPASARSATLPVLRAGLFLGIGLGGFFDGIVFHQLLQTHSMFSGKIDKSGATGLQVNMFWDGAFHLITWTATIAGVFCLWRAASQKSGAPGKVLFGAALSGWGIFNIIEGGVNHHLLGLHHVVETAGLSGFDHAFLASGVILLLAGWRLVRGKPQAAAPGA